MAAAFLDAQRELLIAPSPEEDLTVAILVSLAASEVADSQTTGRGHHRHRQDLKGFSARSASITCNYSLVTIVGEPI